MEESEIWWRKNISETFILTTDHSGIVRVNPVDQILVSEPIFLGDWKYSQVETVLDTD
jgi:hypothetical protein